MQAITSPQTTSPVRMTWSERKGHCAARPNGLCKKTITVVVDGTDHHVVAYYLEEDVLSGRLQRPSTRGDLAQVSISPELVRATNFRYPPHIELGPDGKSYIREENVHDEDMLSQEDAQFRSRNPVPQQTSLHAIQTTQRPAETPSASRNQDFGSATSVIHRWTLPDNALTSSLNMTTTTTPTAYGTPISPHHPHNVLQPSLSSHAFHDYRETAHTGNYSSGIAWGADPSSSNSGWMSYNSR